MHQTVILGRMEELPRAYVLIRLMNPEITEIQWDRFIASTRDDGSRAGVSVACVDGSDVVVGLFTWERRSNLDHGDVFTVDNLVATGALDPAPLLSLMIEHMEAEAEARACGAIQILLPSVYTGAREVKEPANLGSFLDGGFEVIKQKLCKSLPSKAIRSAPEDRSPDALP